MTDVLIVSNVLLWLALVAGAILLLGLARQVGVLHERSAPLGAMVADHGPDVGEKAPVFNVLDFNGRPFQIGGERESGRDSFLLFISPTCPMCNKLLPTVMSVARDEELDVALVSDGEQEDHERFLKEHPLAAIPYVVSSAIGMRFQVGKIPYAVLLDHEGTIKAKGLVNTREHLESLLEANRMGYATLQQYLKDSPDAAKKANGSGEAAAEPATQ